MDLFTIGYLLFCGCIALLVITITTVGYLKEKDRRHLRNINGLGTKSRKG